MEELCVFSPKRTSDDAAPVQVGSSQRSFTLIVYPSIIFFFFISIGDVLYEILQCVKQHRRSVVCETPKVGTSGSEISCQVPPGSLPEQQSLTVRDTSGLWLYKLDNKFLHSVDLLQTRCKHPNEMCRKRKNPGT